MPKLIIYQLFPRVFGNTRLTSVINGTLSENGCGKFSSIDSRVIDSLKELNITHVWLTGVLRHSTRTDYSEYGLPASHPAIVKGMAGSPYAVSDYYDVDPDLADDVHSRMEEFTNLLDRLHSKGLKVMIDFVPNHTAREYRTLNPPGGDGSLGEKDYPELSFSPDNNYYYLPGRQLILPDNRNAGVPPYEEYPAKATGNDVFRPDPGAGDWYETAKLNYGIDYRNGQKHFDPIPDTWLKMNRILLFWRSLGVDGFRCDMAGMVPVEFWSWSIGKVREEYPDTLFIAELYEPEKYSEYLEEGGFDYLYDKVGLYDTLRSILQGRSGTGTVGQVWMGLNGLDNRMLRFLENHDEQRIASRFFCGDGWKALPAMALCTLMNSGPVMIYNGQEVGEPAEGAEGFSGDDGRTSIFDYTRMPVFQQWFNHGNCDSTGLDRKLSLLRIEYCRLFDLAIKIPEFSEGNFYDLMWANEDVPNRRKVFAFLRFGGSRLGRMVLVVVSMDADMTYLNIRIPNHAWQVSGFDELERVTVHQVEPSAPHNVSLLKSQTTGSGIRVSLNSSGYAISLIG